MKHNIKNKNARMGEIVALAPVIPVLQFSDVESAVNTCRALVAGGLPAVEITLRTPQALECIAAVIKQVEGAVVGAGTVLTRDMVIDCVEVGCQFLVAPGATLELLEESRKHATPLLPGISTASEAMGLMSEGLAFAKFFPAEQAGGMPFLKALAPVLPALTFCPTGGLTEEIAVDYLALPNVDCVGGSWVAPKNLVAAGDWDAISALAARAGNLGSESA